MLIERRTIHLRDATPGVVETHQAPFDRDVARTVAGLWQDAFGATEYGVRRLLGELDGYEETCRDVLFLVRLVDPGDSRSEGTIVGTSWYVVAKDNPRLGLLGGVLATPQVRRRGIATLATEATLAHFERHGGQAIYLGTVNPEALRVYEKIGFTTYSGIVRRALVGSARERGDSFDASYFRVVGSTTIRAATWGDQTGISALYFGPNDAVLLDAPTGKFESRVAAQTSCVGFYPPLRDSTVGRAGLLAVLETDDHRIVGTVALHRHLATPVARRAAIDFCIVPGVDGADQLLAFALAHAARLDLTSVVAYVCERDELKAAALARVGFQWVATIPQAVEVDGAEYRLLVFQSTRMAT
jgi:RimJ/RimL family protein N-acetyltransferase